MWGTRNSGEMTSAAQQRGEDELERNLQATQLTPQRQDAEIMTNKRGERTERQILSSATGSFVELWSGRPVKTMAYLLGG
jgi:hypothetical protein